MYFFCLFQIFFLLGSDYQLDAHTGWHRFRFDGFQSRFESHKACLILLSFCHCVSICQCVGFVFVFCFFAKKLTFKTQKSVQIFRVVWFVYCLVCLCVCFLSVHRQDFCDCVCEAFMIFCCHSWFCLTNI